MDQSRGNCLDDRLDVGSTAVSTKYSIQDRYEKFLIDGVPLSVLSIEDGNLLIASTPYKNFNASLTGFP
jgi:hypothetical protein